MNIQTVIDAIEQTPLNGRVKRKAKAAIQRKSDELEPILQHASYRPPEQSFALRITDLIFDRYLSVIMFKDGVPETQRKVAYSQIYRALGGTELAQQPEGGK